MMHRTELGKGSERSRKRNECTLLSRKKKEKRGVVTANGPRLKKGQADFGHEKTLGILQRWNSPKRGGGGQEREERRYHPLEGRRPAEPENKAGKNPSHGIIAERNGKKEKRIGYPRKKPPETTLASSKRDLKERGRKVPHRQNPTCRRKSAASSPRTSREI